MYAVSVVFTIKQEHVDSFRTLIKEHAARTFEREVGCRRFDIGFDSNNLSRVFLYELYEDREAFELHSKADYLEDFFAKASDWIESKEASRWDILVNKAVISERGDS